MEKISKKERMKRIDLVLKELKIAFPCYSNPDIELWMNQPKDWLWYRKPVDIICLEESIDPLLTWIRERKPNV